MDEDRELLSGFFPPGWEALASGSGAGRPRTCSAFCCCISAAATRCARPPPSGPADLSSVALGSRPDGKKEIVDFRRAARESATERGAFLSRLYRRGLTGDGPEMIGVDGGKGLLAALPIVFLASTRLIPPSRSLQGSAAGQCPYP